MRSLCFKIDKNTAGIRLDKVILGRLDESISRGRIQTLIKEGKVLVNGEPAKSSHQTRIDENIKITLPDEKEEGPAAEAIPLAIVYEDEWLLVLNKPAGMVTHPGTARQKHTLVNALLSHCDKLSHFGGELKPGIVHRLDKDTSGLLVVAKTDEVHRDLAGQFKKRVVAKEYLAIVKGSMEFDEGSIDLPLGRSPKDRKRIMPSFVDGKEAVTEYRVIDRFAPPQPGRAGPRAGAGFTLVKLMPRTGRTHQLRVHLAHLGHPVAGDRTYGGGTSVPRQALHASKLKFRHPALNKDVQFEAPFPEDMNKFLGEIS